jgi:universal stress protein A
MFTRILVPTDFSEPSDAALDYARVIATTFGASLHVVHVVHTPAAMISAEVYITDPQAFRAQLFDDAQRRLNHRVTASDRTRYAATTEVASGSIADSIIDCAKERGIDLIVMGTHGRSGVAHLLMGSVAEQVVRHAPCPVMTVHQAPSSAARVPEGLHCELMPPNVERQPSSEGPQRSPCVAAPRKITGAVRLLWLQSAIAPCDRRLAFRGLPADVVDTSPATS